MKQISGYENDTLANYPIVINKVYNNYYHLQYRLTKSQQTQNIDNLKITY